MISESNPRRNRVIGDRRQLLVAESVLKKQKELFAKISVGDRMEGTVKTLQILEHSSTSVGRRTSSYL